MKITEKVACLAILLCLLCASLAGCSDTNPAPDSSSSAGSAAQSPADSPDTPAAEPQVPQPPEIKQYYSLDDFLVAEADELLFRPQGTDYIMTESYWLGSESYVRDILVGGELKQMTSDIIYHLTVIREFDESGKLIARKEKYTFQTDWVVPKDVYFQDMIDNPKYENVKLVERVLYADVKQEQLDTAETKQQLVERLTEQGSKLYMSAPIRTAAQQAAQDAYIAATPATQTPYSISVKMTSSKQAEIVLGGVTVRNDIQNAKWCVCLDNKYAVSLNVFDVGTYQGSATKVTMDGQFKSHEYLGEIAYKIDGNTLTLYADFSDVADFDFGDISVFTAEISEDGDGWTPIDFTLNQP